MKKQFSSILNESYGPRNKSEEVKPAEPVEMKPDTKENVEPATEKTAGETVKTTETSSSAVQGTATISKEESIPQSSPAATQQTAPDTATEPVVEMPVPRVETPVIIPGIAKPDRGFGLNQDGTYRQSLSGRKAMDASKKKVQITLTLPPNMKKRLEEAAEDKSRSAANYASEFLEKHFEELVRYIEER